MLPFSNRPPEAAQGHSLPLHRTPATRPIFAVVTSDDLIGLPTHFYGGRTVPCDNEDCEPCSNSVPWRWHGYVSAIGIERRLHFLFEFTAQASDSFVAYKTKYGTLRGCQFKAYRLKKLPNARVMIETTPADLTKIQLPKAPDLPRTLCTIWGIPLHRTEQKRTINNRPRLDLQPAIPDDPCQNQLHHRPPSETIRRKPA
jgi:hypothetical protein